MKPVYKAILLLVAIPIFGWIGYLVQQHAAGTSGQTKARKVAYYQDSMHPWIKSDQPGKCTICAMDLTPIFEGEKGFAADDQTLVLKSNSITVLNVQAEEVKRRPLSRMLRVAGTLEADEARKSIISAPAPCRIQSVGIEFTGVEIEKGHTLVTVFSPELVQKRGYLQALSVIMPGLSNDLAQAARKSDAFSTELVAPQTGTVVERNVFQGQYVPEGEKLFTLVDSSVLWFRFDIYQRQLPWVEPGQTMAVTVEGVPGKVFPGLISFIEPTLNEATRTVKVRANINNPVVATNGHPRRLLRLGMYAEGTVEAKVPNLLAVPRSAVLFPGGSAYAYVELGDGAYERRRVKLGREGDELWEVLQGLEEGDRVVTTGNVLLDAQAQFNHEVKPEEALARETPTAEPTAAVGLDRQAVVQVAAASSAPAAMPRTAAAPSPRMALPAPIGMGGMIGTPATPPPERPQASSRRTQLMSAIMSPGGEVQLARQATIAAELARNAAKATSAPTAQLTGAPAAVPMQPHPAGMTMPSAATPAVETNVSPSQPASQAAPPNAPPLAGGGVQAYRDADRARAALRDDMRLTRQALITQAHAAKTAETNTLSASQRQALEVLMSGADQISQALAGDNLEKVNQQIQQLPTLLPPVQKELGATHPWSALVERLAAVQWQPAKDLAAARKQFLPFSTATVDLVKQLRKAEPAFAGLKVYHCPMAPKPGLWIQAKGPLRNPFFGAEMLECGKEVAL